MANTRSAEKRIRQTAVRQARNRSYRTRMRNAIRDLRAHADSGETEAAKAALPATLSIIDTTAQKGIIHRSTAGRYKSRLTKLVQRQASAAVEPSSEEATTEAESE